MGVVEEASSEFIVDVEIKSRAGENPHIPWIPIPVAPVVSPEFEGGNADMASQDVCMRRRKSKGTQVRR